MSWLLAYWGKFVFVPYRLGEVRNFLYYKFAQSVIRLNKAKK